MATKKVVREIDPKDAVVTVEVGSGKKATEVTEVVKTSVRSFVKALKQERDLKAQKAEAIEVLRKYVGELRDKNAYAGDYQKTYKVLGPVEEDGLVYATDVTQTSKYSLPKDQKDIEALKALIPADLFDEVFEKELSISIRPEILKDDTARKEFTRLILDCMGVEGLKKYFNKEETYKVKKGFDEKQYHIDPDHRRAILDVAVPASDSVKDTSFIDEALKEE